MPTKVHLVKAMVFSSGHVWMWELDCEESWAPKNWSFWSVVVEKTIESSLDCKEIQLVHPKGNQSWIFIRRTDAEAETPIFGYLLWRIDPLEKTMLLGKETTEGGDGWMASPTWWTWVWASSGSWWWIRKPGSAAFLGVTKSRARLSYWTDCWFTYWVLFLKSLLSQASISWLP